MAYLIGLGSLLCISNSNSIVEHGFYYTTSAGPDEVPRSVASSGISACSALFPNDLLMDARLKTLNLIKEQNYIH